MADTTPRRSQRLANQGSNRSRSPSPSPANTARTSNEKKKKHKNLPSTRESGGGVIVMVLCMSLLLLSITAFSAVTLMIYSCGSARIINNEEMFNKFNIVLEPIHRIFAKFTGISHDTCR